MAAAKGEVRLRTTSSTKARSRSATCTAQPSTARLGANSATVVHAEAVASLCGLRDGVNARSAVGRWKLRFTWERKAG